MDDKVVYYKSLRKKFLTFKVLVTVALLLILIAGAVGGYKLYESHQAANNAAKKQQAAFNSVLATAQTYANKGNFQAEFITLQDEIGKTKTKTQELTLYGELAPTALNVNEYSQAISYYKIRHELDPSTVQADADTLGQCYLDIGDKADALAQYKIALAYYKAQPQTPTLAANGTIPFIQAQVDNLEGN